MIKKEEMKIDAHNHIISSDLFEKISSQTSYNVRRDQDGNLVTTRAGGNKIPMISIKDRIAEMDYYGINRQILSFIIFRFFSELRADFDWVILRDYITSLKIRPLI